MSDTRWYYNFTATRVPGSLLLGLWFVRNTNAWGYPNMHLLLAVGRRTWNFWVYKARRLECLTKPGKPSSAG